MQYTPKTHQIALFFQIFSWVHAPISPLQARSYNIVISLYETIVFYTNFYQNMHQNAGNMS